MMPEHDTFESALAGSWGVRGLDTGDELVEQLEVRIAWLMKHDYERLVNALYLLDLSESKFREAMELATNEATARALAELVLARERDKFESRKRYRQARSTTVEATEIDPNALPPAE